MKTSELTGADLDLWVAKATGRKTEFRDGEWWVEYDDGYGMLEMTYLNPHEDWAIGGKLLAKLPRLRIQENSDGFAVQSFPDAGCMIPVYGYGETILIAAMRCLVASVYGDTVPDEVPK